eukprot:Lankesteria_metandrocarpae@DN4045_c0_g1_i3.p1
MNLVVGLMFIFGWCDAVEDSTSYSVGNSLGNIDNQPNNDIEDWDENDMAALVNTYLPLVQASGDGCHDFIEEAGPRVPSLELVEENEAVQPKDSTPSPKMRISHRNLPTYLGNMEPGNPALPEDSLLRKDANLRREEKPKLKKYQRENAQYSVIKENIMAGALISFEDVQLINAVDERRSKKIEGQRKYKKAMRTIRNKMKRGIPVLPSEALLVVKARSKAREEWTAHARKRRAKLAAERIEEAKLLMDKAKRLRLEKS